MNLATLAVATQFGRVFPLNPLTKAPVPKFKWKRWSTVDLQTINQWLTEYPQCNWALVPDRAFVVDVDIKEGATGPESLEAVGGLDPTFTVRTPSGGSHHYYAPDPDVPFKTSNGWLPGVDIRYGGDGYVVLPYSRVGDGAYMVQVDLEQLETSMSLATCSSGSLLPQIPDWIKTKILEEPIQELNKHHVGPRGSVGIHRDSIKCDITRCDKDWDEITSQVRYMFFRRKANGCIWNHIPIEGMQDRSQSGYEWQLAVRLMNVGATDDEVVTWYRVWCRKHNLKIKHHRLIRQTIPNARLATAEYVAAWKASQPLRRKHGSTTSQIIEAIQAGCKASSEIEKYTSLKGSSVRMHLKRMLSAGKLVKDSSGYAIPSVCRLVAGLEAA